MQVFKVHSSRACDLLIPQLAAPEPVLRCAAESCAVARDNRENGDRRVTGFSGFPSAPMIGPSIVGSGERPDGGDVGGDVGIAAAAGVLVAAAAAAFAFDAESDRSCAAETDARRRCIAAFAVEMPPLPLGLGGVTGTEGAGGCGESIWAIDTGGRGFEEESGAGVP
jgi:hypothetical protein